jgi:hypothetical protein
LIRRVTAAEYSSRAVEWIENAEAFSREERSTDAGFLPFPSQASV